MAMNPLTTVRGPLKAKYCNSTEVRQISAFEGQHVARNSCE